MKKILLIGIALLAFGYNQAQVFTIAGKDIGFVYVGPKYGMGTSFISNYTPDGVDTKLFLNVVGGVVGKFGITENLSIQPELLFSRKGGKSKIEFPDFVDPNETATTTSKNIANYIGIPILAKFSFLKIKDIKLHGSGGFYTNITTGQKFKSVTKDTNGTSEFEEIIPSNHYKTVDFGLSIGGGAEIEMGPGLLVGELLVDHGFVDNYDDFLMTGSNRHTSVTIAFTYLYDLMKLIK